MKDRAETYSQKEEVMQRLLIAWKSMPKLRLGQFLVNALYHCNNNYDLFQIEDFEIIRNVETFLRDYGTK